jgi:ribosomal protein S18 acetylase RimI-like enzyme
MASDDDFRPEESVVVGDADGLPVGFVLIAGSWIEQIGVVPRWRRQGIARGLVSQAIASIGDAGSEEIWLNVNENNAPAIELYAELGFVQFGRRGRFQQLATPR